MSIAAADDLNLSLQTTTTMHLPKQQSHKMMTSFYTNPNPPPRPILPRPVIPVANNNHNNNNLINNNLPFFLLPVSYFYLFAFVSFLIFND